MGTSIRLKEMHQHDDLRESDIRKGEKNETVDTFFVVIIIVIYEHLLEILPRSWI